MKTCTADPELNALLKAAAGAGEPLRVRTDEETYEIAVRRPAKDDIWKAYAPEALGAALDETSGILKDIDPEAWIAFHLNGVGSAVPQLHQLRDYRIAMSAISYMEVLDGLEHQPPSHITRQRFERLTATVPIVPFTSSTAETCGRIRAALRR